MRVLAVAGLAALVVAETLVLLRRGSWWSMVAVGLALAVLLACRLMLKPREGAAEVAAPERVESLPRWQTRTETLISWSEGSRADWNKHLRPVLLRELRKVATPGHEVATGTRLFGAQLWPWIDPSARTTAADADLPGPGRAVLGAILDRLDLL